ncbi:MAG: ATP-binding protein, partial [Planctomycetaceae bacterium]
DPTVQNRPVAARLLQVRPGSTSPPEVATNFRRGRLFGREKEMAIAEQWVHSVVAGRPTRLHIRGDSGIGKTWFLAELLRRIRANPWFQVFDSACSDRADVPFQAFDAMADGIARRYSRDDREPLRLSARHAILLRQALPSLRPVLPAPDLTHEELSELLDATTDEQQIPGVASPGEETIDLRAGFARSDSLASGVALVNAMCEYGPLFLIIDDIQWADQDSINALDQLLSDADGNLGIISVGRLSADRFRVPADCYIDLEPLTDSDSMALLRSLLCVKETPWSELALTRLATLGEGNAYRLTQLAACVAHDNPMEWHDRLLAGPIEIEDIWQNRLLHLSDEAKLVIETLAVAGGRTRMRDLTATSGLLSRCDEAIKELIHLRLVYDEAPKVDAVQIIHHRVACRILSSMDPLRFRELHKSWANYLISCEHEPWRAARVAGHLIEANEPEAAVPYMIQAARDAEARFAFTESARWYQRAARNTQGPETVTFLSQALTRFEDAGCPSEAAEVCRDLLAYLPTGESSVDRIPFLHRLANNLFCCGQTQAAMDVVDQIAARLRTGNCDDQERDLLREACLSLHRPVMTFDARKAAELLRIAMGRTKVEVTTASNPVLRGAVDAALTQCRNPGRRRKRNSARLQAFIDDARQSDRPWALAVATSGMAYRHLLACDWASTVSCGNMALDLFRANGPACRFDLALTHLPVLWAFLWLGRLNELKSLSDRLTRESFEGNDEYLHQIVHAGPGCAVSLMDDEVQLVRSVSSRFVRRSRALESPWLDLFQGFAPILRRLYEAQSLRALRYHRTLMGGARSKILKQVQLPRVLSLQLEGLAHLRSACALPVERSGSIAHVFHVCELLEHERIAYAKALSKLFAAQSYEIIGDKDRCLSLYDEAADIADSLDLVPFRLVAVDRIRMVRGDSHSSELKRFLSLEGVTAPEKFARLYCGLCP